MKKLLILVGLFIGFSAYAQNPDYHRYGVRTPFTKYISYTTSQRDALTPSSTDRTIIHHKDTGINRLEQWDGDSWEELGGFGAVESVQGYIGAVVINPDDLDDTSTTNKFVTSTEKGLIATALQDAPSDGNEYVRKDGDWEVATAGGDNIYNADGTLPENATRIIDLNGGALSVADNTGNPMLIISDNPSLSDYKGSYLTVPADTTMGILGVYTNGGKSYGVIETDSLRINLFNRTPEIGQILVAKDTLGTVEWQTPSGGAVNAENVIVSPAIGGNTDAYAVMDDHEDRIDALESASSINTEFQAVTFSSTLNYTHDNLNPNKYIDATSSSTITITTTNGDAGQLHINDSSAYTFTFVQDGDDLVIYGNGETLEMWYQHTDKGLKWRVIYLGFNTASGGSEACGNYTEVVLIGDSITEQAFGQSLVTPNANVMSKLAALGITGVDVYGYGWGGYTMADILPKIDEAKAAHPNAFFIVCIGVNDMKAESYTTRTPTQLTDYGLALDAVEAKFSAIPNQLCLLPLPYLPLANPTVDDSMYTNPTGGAQPYNEDFYLPRIPTYFQNTDGYHILDWYNYLRNNRMTHYEVDGIHQNSTGEEGLREFVSERLAYLIRYVPRPAALTDISPTDNLVFNVDHTSVDATATTEGDDVDLWTDTVAGLNATQTDTLSPTLHINSVSSKREVSFNGTKYMSAGTASDLNFVGGVDDFTIIIKVGETPFDSSTAWWVSKTISTSNTAQYGIIRLGGGISTFLRGALNIGTETTINAGDLIIWKVSTTQQTLTVNDSVILDVAVTTANAPNNTGVFTIGGQGNGTNLATGNYEFVKVYDKALTTEEINIIKSVHQVN